MRVRYMGFGFVFLLVAGLSFGQSSSPDSLLKKGRVAYDYDKIDSAVAYFNRALHFEDPNIQLKALTGLLKVQISQADMEVADSLVTEAERLSSHPGISQDAVFSFKIIKGEYLRKNSRFAEALQQQQEVINAFDNRQKDDLNLAYALYYAAMAYERMGKYDSSLVYMHRAYPLFEALMDTTDIRFSGIYNGMGICYYRNNQLDEAKVFYVKSKSLAEAKRGPVSSDLAICLNNLSSISRSQENYREAIDYSKQALDIFRELEDEAGMSGAYYALGVYHYFLGDYGRCRDYMEACIAIRERLYDKHHFSLIGPYEVLGIAHEQAGHYEKTLYYFRKVREHIKANFGPGSLEEAFNYENSAICFQSLGRLDSALHYINLSNDILTRQLPENDYSLAVHYFTFGNILFDLDRLDEAIAKLTRSNQIYVNLGLKESSENAQSEAILGLIESEKENWLEADGFFLKALEKIETEGDAENSTSYQMTPNSLTILNAYTDYLFQKYRAKGDPEVLREFEAFAAVYLNLSDKFRKQFYDPYTKHVLIEDNAEVYERIIGIYNYLYRQEKKQAYIKSALRFSEYGRTSLLRDMQDEKIQSYVGVPDSILKKEVAIKKQITKLNQDLLNYPDSTGIKQALFRQKEALSNLINRISQVSPRYHQLKYSSRIFSFEEIRNFLSPLDNAIEFMQDDTAYYGLILNRDTSALLYLGNRRKINERVQNWKKHIIQRNETELVAISGELYETLWLPLEKYLKGERVIIVPVGPLFYVNFELLEKDSSAKSYLIHSYNISYALSFNELFANKQEDSGGPVLAVAPGFEDDIKVAYEQKTDGGDIDQQYLQTVRQPWSLKLAKTLGDKFSSKVLTGVEATESNVKAHISKGNLLFFGSHAIANSEDPLYSRLVLAKELDDKKEDGYLHAFEFYGLPLEAEIAILNACESGLGHVQKGEGMISLAYSIHYAGCPSTVMSLWKVDEKINTGITRDFLSHLSDGLPKSEALRQAKLDYLADADGKLHHPFYWGGMVMQGSDGLVHFEEKTPTWPLYLALGIVVLLIAWWGIKNFLGFS